MSFFKTPECTLETFQERAKFKFVWKINIVFTIIGFFLILLSLTRKDESYTYYSLVFILSLSGVFLLKILKEYRQLAIVLLLAISTVLVLAIFMIPDTLHIQEGVSMIVVIVCAFFTIGKYWGTFFTCINVVVYIIYYNFLFSGVHGVNYTIELDSLFLMSIEFAISMFLIAFVMYQYGLINRYALKNASDSYEELNAEKQVVELQNKEKTVLLQEIHHRVKNNLQVIVSLLRLQSREIKSEEAKESFEDAVTRILTMSLIHQKLYEKESLIDIDIQDYLNTLIKNLVDSSSIDKNIDFKVNVTLKSLSAENIVPLGLIISELVTNSMKHAFDKLGRIELILTSKEGNNFRMTYFDNGTWKENSNKTFGTQLIEVFTEQLDGTFKREINDLGTFYHFILTEQNVEGQK